VLVAWTIIHRSAEELRGGLRPVESGDKYRPTSRKVGDEPILRVVVLNEGPDFRAWTAPRAEGVLSERGRGLGLAAEFTDSLEFDHLQGRTEATLSKRYA
jgi:anti-sigma regulatory factor (Ser/Thr protein kinase)